MVGTDWKAPVLEGWVTISSSAAAVTDPPLTTARKLCSCVRVIATRERHYAGAATASCADRSEASTSSNAASMRSAVARVALWPISPMRQLGGVPGPRPPPTSMWGHA